jgi:hypothetical protein
MKIGHDHFLLYLSRIDYSLIILPFGAVESELLTTSLNRP